MLTREEAEHIYDQGKEYVVKVLMDFSKRLTLLEAEVERLNGQLNKNSRNSHKPPSTDGLKKPPPKKQKKKTKKTGAQPGHKSSTLEPVDNPDHTLKMEVTHCEHCATNLEDVKATFQESHQVFDLPKKLFEVTEYQTETKLCPCCERKTASAFPQNALAKTQYGERLKAFFAYLHLHQYIPYKRVAEFCGEVFGLPISQGVIFNSIKKAYNRLEPFETQLRDFLVNQPVLHFDESGMRKNGKTVWMHTTSHPLATLLTLHNKRGRIAMDEINILPQFEGVAVHDGYASYQKYPCTHALCGAHLLRDLESIIDSSNSFRAKEMKNFLKKTKTKVDSAREKGFTSLPESEVQLLEKEYHRILKWGWKANPPPPPNLGKPGKTKQGKFRNLWKRLEEGATQVLLFMKNFDVPFDNNLAERDIRGSKLRQKISNCFRGEKGAKHYCRIKSYLSTLKKHGEQVFPALVSLFEGKLHIPDKLYLQDQK